MPAGTPAARCSACSSRTPRPGSATLTAHSNAGTLLGAHQPHLRSLADRVLAPTGVDELAGHDVVVLALPHGASGAIAAELEARGDGAIVVDLGADHRLVDAADWEQFYGSAARRHLAVRPARAAAPGGADRDRAAGGRSPARGGSPSRAATSPPSPSASSRASPPG